MILAASRWIRFHLRFGGFSSFSLMFCIVNQIWVKAREQIVQKVFDSVGLNRDIDFISLLIKNRRVQSRIIVLGEFVKIFKMKGTITYEAQQL